jgi:hypothetical protein
MIPCNRRQGKKPAPQEKEMEKLKMLTYSITYQIWDEEAVEAGDTDDKGFLVVDEKVSLREFIEIFKDGGFIHPSCSDPMQADWWSNEPEMDPYTGEYEHRSFHPYWAGMTQHQEHRIKRILWKVAK